MESTENTEAPQPIVDEDEINLFDLIAVILKRKRFIVVYTAVLLVLIFIVLMIMSPVYQGVARLLPPQSVNSTTEILAQLAGATGLSMGATGTQPTSSTYAGMLTSRTILDAVLDKYNLIEFYKKDRFLGRWRSYTRDDARDTLTDMVDMEADTTTNIITATINDKDAKRAAAMANTFVDELRKMIQELSVLEANQRKVFYDREIKKTLDNLTLAEESMKKFQENSGVLLADEQAKAMMDRIAMLEAQIAAKEIQIQVINTYATASNPDMKRAVSELAALKDERDKLEAKSAGAQNFPGNVTIPTAQVPELGMEYLRKLRDLKYQQTLWDVLIKQYETARLDETKETPNVQVVDIAIPPEKSAKPKVILIMVIAVPVSLFLSMLMAFLLEYLEKSSANPANRVRMNNIKRYLRRF